MRCTRHRVGVQMDHTFGVAELCSHCQRDDAAGWRSLQTFDRGTRPAAVQGPAQRGHRFDRCMSEVVIPRESAARLFDLEGRRLKMMNGMSSRLSSFNAGRALDQTRRFRTAKRRDSGEAFPRTVPFIGLVTRRLAKKGSTW